MYLSAKALTPTHLILLMFSFSVDFWTDINRIVVRSISLLSHLFQSLKPLKYKIYIYM